ncbi:MAG: hypothetical protein R3C45_07600 [Phycisphaerales bacterium]
MGDDQQRHDAAQDEDEEQHHVGPDNGRDPAEKRPGDRDDADDGDRGNKRVDPDRAVDPVQLIAEDQLEDDRGEVDARRLREQAHEREHGGGHRACGLAELVAHVVVGAVDPVLVVGGDQHEGDEQP